jgi:hypothetical protein
MPNPRATASAVSSSRGEKGLENRSRPSKSTGRGQSLGLAAWFEATCPNSSFRNGQQAVKDAKAACSITAWKDENMTDTLAAAYAETGNFDSAVRYAAKALAVKGISAQNAKVFNEHVALFQQRKRFPVSQ